jgi:hypothetical protein
MLQINMNFYIRKIISIILIPFFLFLFYFSPNRVIRQTESVLITKTPPVLQDTTDQENLATMKDQVKSDNEKNAKIKESTSMRSAISVNLLLYLIYKLTFRNAE